MISFTSMKCGFFLKKHVKCGKMIKSNLFKVCSIAFYTFSPSFEQFVNTTSIKSSFFLQTIHRAIFSHLRTYQTATLQVCDPSMQTNGNRKEPSPLSKSHGVELPSWVVPTCREPFLPYVIGHFHEENVFVLPLSACQPCFKQVNLVNCW